MSSPGFNLNVERTSYPPKSVNVAAIERELAQLLYDAQADKVDGPPPSITRAVMSNLIIYCTSREQAHAMPGEIALIVELHPARVLLLVADEKSASSEIEAYVSAHCHMVAGGRQVCSEHVTVAASGGAVRRLPSAARALLIGDLPTALWWADNLTPPPLGGDIFTELSLMVDEVIYESLGWLEPARGVLATAEWAGSELNEQILADLQWRRLKGWRRLISQALAPEVLPEALTTVTEMRVEHGPHGLPQAWQLVGWLAARLGWKPSGGRVKPGQEITWGFQSAHGPVKITVVRHPEGAPEVHRAAIHWKGKDGPQTAHFTIPGPGRLQAVIGDTAPRILASPEQSRASLVAKQLPDLDRDSVFKETLRHSGTMARALV